MTIKEWIKKDEVMDIIKGLPQDLWEEYIFMLKGVWCDEDMHLETLQAEPKTKCIAQIEVDTEEVVKRIKEEYDIMDGWIPCSERLPNKKDLYMVTLKTFSDDYRFIDLLYYGKPLMPNCKVKDACWYRSDSEWGDVVYDDTDILAWMPLPKPYREDDEA